MQKGMSQFGQPNKVDPKGKSCVVGCVTVSRVTNVLAVSGDTRHGTYRQWAVWTHERRPANSDVRSARGAAGD